jgi:hypothetical protein
LLSSTRILIPILRDTCTPSLKPIAIARRGRGMRSATFDINMPILHSRDYWMKHDVPKDLKPGQAAIGWASHVVFFYPL